MSIVRHKQPVDVLVETNGHVNKQGVWPQFFWVYDGYGREGGRHLAHPMWLCRYVASSQLPVCAAEFAQHLQGNPWLLFRRCAMQSTCIRFLDVRRSRPTTCHAHALLNALNRLVAKACLKAVLRDSGNSFWATSNCP